MMKKVLTDSKMLPYYKRKIKCPRHYQVIPGKSPFLLEVNPFMKDCKLSDADCKKFGIRRYKVKRDRFGNKLQDFSNYYQPEISAAFAIEQIYDPIDPICKQCRGRCLEGQGSMNLGTIKRLKDE